MSGLRYRPFPPRVGMLAGALSWSGCFIPFLFNRRPKLKRLDEGGVRKQTRGIRAGMGSTCRRWRIQDGTEARKQLVDAEMAITLKRSQKHRKAIVQEDSDGI